MEGIGQMDNISGTLHWLLLEHKIQFENKLESRKSIFIERNYRSLQHTHVAINMLKVQVSATA